MKENVVHLHNGILFSCKNQPTKQTNKKNNDIMKFEGQRRELERTIPSKLRQTQKDKHGIFSLISEYSTQSKG